MKAASGTSWRSRGWMVSAPRNIVSSKPRARRRRSVKTCPRSRSAASWISSTARNSTRRSSGIASTVHTKYRGAAGNMRSSPVIKAAAYAPPTCTSPSEISPDAGRVAFVRVPVNARKAGYDTAIWMVDTEGGRAPRPLTAGPQDLSPRWSPAGRRLAFTRAVEKAGKPQPAQLYVMTMEGGEARALTDVAKGASSPVWSPDGRMLAFTGTANPKDLERAARKGGDAAEE